MSYLSRDILCTVLSALVLGACQEASPSLPSPSAADSGTSIPMPMVTEDAGTKPPTSRMFVPEPARYHRLTRTQYLNTLKDLFGEELLLPENLEVDTFIYGFTSIGASELTISPRTAELYEEAAFSVAAQVVGNEMILERVLACAPSLESSDCARGFMSDFGLKAWRRPVQVEEIQRWVSVFESARQIFNNPLKGIEYVLAGMLQSPSFLFRVELGEETSSGAADRQYTSWEMASRLSYLIWQSTPDQILLDAAANDELRTAEQVRSQAQRMLAEPQAKTGLSHFFREYLKLDRLDVLTQDPDTFPQVTETLGVSMRTELLMLVEAIIFGETKDIRGLFSASFSFVNQELARLYTLTEPLENEGFSKIQWPANSPRGGVLTSAAFLALNSHSTVTSPTLRGRFVRQFLMCQDIAPPPPGVTTTLPEPSGEPQTLRQRLEELHLADAQCAGCHSLMDPLGFGFENFDAVGAYRTTDNGLPVDSSGSLDGRTFKNAKELSTTIAQNPKFAQCLTLMVFRHAAGHLETEGEEVSLVDVYNAFVDSGHDFQALVLAMVSSDAFRMAKDAE